MQKNKTRHTMQIEGLVPFAPRYNIIYPLTLNINLTAVDLDDAKHKFRLIIRFSYHRANKRALLNWLLFFFLTQDSLCCAWGGEKNFVRKSIC